MIHFKIHTGGVNKDRHRGAECKQMLNRLAQLENNGGLLMFRIIGSFSAVSVADASVIMIV